MSSPDDAISVNMEQWTIKHRAFVVEASLKNNESVITTQRLFRLNFMAPFVLKTLSKG